MIVKLDTTKVDGDRTGRSWVYFDGFRKVKAILLKKDDGIDIYESDYVVYDYKSKVKGMFLIICSLKYAEAISGKAEYTILTNQTAYLLNDEGKTIERIA